MAQFSDGINMRDGFTSKRVALMAATVVFVAALRPIDSLPLLPVFLHTTWRTLSTGAPLESITRRLGAPFGAIATVAAICLGLHYAIYGAAPSSYMKHSSAFGLDPTIIPFRFAVIFGDPAPFFGGGTALLDRYPFTAIGLWALVYVTFWYRKFLAAASVAWLSLFVYLSYPDFLPTGLWRYMNIHYWKWLFPALAMLTLVAVRHAFIERRAASFVLSLVLTAPLVILSLQSVAALPSESQVQGQRIRLIVDKRTSIAAIRLDGVDGVDSHVYWGDHQLVVGDRVLRHIVDFRLVRAGGQSMFLVPNRPLTATYATVILDARLKLTPQVAAQILQPQIGVRNPFRRLMSDADRHIEWPADWLRRSLSPLRDTLLKSGTPRRPLQYSPAVQAQAASRISNIAVQGLLGSGSSDVLDG